MKCWKCLLILVVGLSSCQDSSKSLPEARKYYLEYLLNNDKTYLDKTYESLKSRGYLEEHGLNEQNRDIVVMLLLQMKKYDELEGLLTANQDMRAFDKNLALNLTRSLAIYPEDSVEAKRLMLENLQLVENEMEANPNDSLLWGSHFTARMYLVGREKALQEIDSLKSVDDRYSDIFYEYTLKELIKEYPDELMYKRK